MTDGGPDQGVPGEKRPGENGRRDSAAGPESGRGAVPGQDGGPASDAETYDPTGLGLARAIAGSVAGSKYRRRRTGRRPAEPLTPQSTGAHPDDRDPQLLNAAMSRMVDSQGWSRQISVRLLLGRWPALVGPVNAAHSRPVGYADTVVTVRTDATAWATQLRTLAPQLVAKLNAELGDGTVTRIEILGPEVPSWKKGRRSVRDGRGPRDTYG